MSSTDVFVFSSIWAYLQCKCKPCERFSQPFKNTQLHPTVNVYLENCDVVTMTFFTLTHQVLENVIEANGALHSIVCTKYRSEYEQIFIGHCYLSIENRELWCLLCELISQKFADNSSFLRIHSRLQSFRAIYLIVLFSFFFLELLRPIANQEFSIHET